MKFLTPYADRIQSLFRIILALVILQYGLSKIFGCPASQYSHPSFLSLSYLAGLIELIGGTLLLIGYRTRPTAFVLSGFMAAAYFIGHASESFFPFLNGGNLAVVLCFSYLQMAASGGGAFSLDRALGLDPHPARSPVR